MLVNRAIKVFVFVEVIIAYITGKCYITNCDMRHEGNKQECIRW